MLRYNRLHFAIKNEKWQYQLLKLAFKKKKHTGSCAFKRDIVEQQTKEVMKLYKTLDLLLEYCVQFWVLLKEQGAYI